MCVYVSVWEGGGGRESKKKVRENYRLNRGYRVSENKMEIWKTGETEKKGCKGERVLQIARGGRQEGSRCPFKSKVRSCCAASKSFFCWQQEKKQTFWLLSLSLTHTYTQRERQRERAGSSLPFLLRSHFIYILNIKCHLSPYTGFCWQCSMQKLAPPQHSAFPGWRSREDYWT